MVFADSLYGDFDRFEEEALRCGEITFQEQQRSEVVQEAVHTPAGVAGEPGLLFNSTPTVADRAINITLLISQSGKVAVKHRHRRSIRSR